MKQYKTLAGVIAAVRAKGTELDLLIAQGIKFCVDQAQQGNFDGFAKLAEACPVYARSVVKTAEKAARETHKNRSWRAEASDLAQAEAETVLAERREKTAAQRRKTAPNQNKPEASETPKDTSAKVEQYQLVHFDGEKATKTALTKAEYDAAMEAVQKVREASRKPRLATANKEAVNAKRLNKTEAWNDAQKVLAEEAKELEASREHNRGKIRKAN